MALESLRACLDASAGGAEGIVGALVLCFTVAKLLNFVAVFAMVAVILSLLLAHRDRARREDADLDVEELARRTREIQKKWHWGLFWG